MLLYSVWITEIPQSYCKKFIVKKKQKYKNRQIIVWIPSQHSHNELYINNRWPAVSPRDDNADHWGDTAVLLMSRVEEVVMDSVLGCLTLQREQNDIFKIWQQLKVCSKIRTCCQIWFVLMILNNDKVWTWRSSGVLWSYRSAQ